MSLASSYCFLPFNFDISVLFDSDKVISLPVKLTKPLTSILYVSNDKNHLVDMRKVVQHVEVPVLGKSERLGHSITIKP